MMEVQAAMIGMNATIYFPDRKFKGVAGKTECTWEICYWDWHLSGCRFRVVRMVWNGWVNPESRSNEITFD